MPPSPINALAIKVAAKMPNHKSERNMLLTASCVLDSIGLLSDKLAAVSYGSKAKSGSSTASFLFFGVVLGFVVGF
jgi:hypothetical protein